MRRGGECLFKDTSNTSALKEAVGVSDARAASMQMWPHGKHMRLERQSTFFFFFSPQTCAASMRMRASRASMSARLRTHSRLFKDI